MYLDKINFEDTDNIALLSKEAISKIEGIIKKYADDCYFYDSTQTYKDTYINTIRLQSASHTIYLIFLQHYPTGEINSKVLFYDNKKKHFIKDVFDFNIWALYNLNNGKLIVSELKSYFNITSPEIERFDYNGDSIEDYKFVRLYHNGTANAIHTTILTTNYTKIDTLYFCEKGLGNFVEEKECL